MNGWVSVENGNLPPATENNWERYIVCVTRSHWPRSSYDFCDAPYSEEYVTTAAFDDQQKIWHLDGDMQLNALIRFESAPINGDYVTHWMPLPKPPKED